MRRLIGVLTVFVVSLLILTQPADAWIYQGGSPKSQIFQQPAYYSSDTCQWIANATLLHIQGEFTPRASATTHPTLGGHCTEYTGVNVRYRRISDMRLVHTGWRYGGTSGAYATSPANVQWDWMNTYHIGKHSDYGWSRVLSL